MKVLVGAKVEKVPLERYVRGVVSAEMPSSWPLAALEAQAIASRTYALTADAGGSRFDVYSDTRSQVYLGVAAETASTNAAVAATAGQIVTYAGQPAITYFFASSGGMTEDVQNSFLGSDARAVAARRRRRLRNHGLRAGSCSISFAVRRGAPARPRQGRLPRDRGAQARRLAADRRPPRCSARAARTAGQRPGTRRAARAWTARGRTSASRAARASHASPTAADRRRSRRSPESPPAPVPAPTTGVPGRRARRPRPPPRRASDRPARWRRGRLAA